MSLGNPLKIMDTRQDYTEQLHEKFLLGPDEVQSLTVPATNPASLQQQQFNVNIPSNSCGMCRAVKYHLNINFTVVGTTTGTNLLDGNSFGLSDNPADQAIASETVKFGTRQNAVQRSTCLELTRINTDSDLQANYLSGDACLPDNCTNFFPFINSNMSVLQPVSDYNPSDKIAKPRTANIRIVSTSATTTVLNADIYFDSRVSPFNQLSTHNGKYLRGLGNSVIFTLQMGDITRMLSISTATNGGPNTITSVTPLINQSTLQVMFITPNVHSVIDPLNFVDIYDYQEINQWINPAGNTFTAATGYNTANPNIYSGQVNLQQISGNVVPELLIFSVRIPQVNDGSYANPRFYLPIINTNLKFNNKTVLNGLSPRQLYEISVRNGLEMSYEQWFGRCVTPVPAANRNQILSGGILIVNPSLDFGISSMNLVNSAKCAWSLNGSVTAQNQSELAFVPELSVIAIYDGKCTVTCQSGNADIATETGLFEQNEIMMLLSQPGFVSSSVFTHQRKGGYSGGSFWGKIWHGLSSVGRWVWNNRKDIIDAAGKVYDVAKKFGAGLIRRNHIHHEEPHEEMYVERRFKKHH